MVIVCPPPSIVRVFWIAGRLLPSVMVPLTLKTIVSVPVPATQLPPVVSDLLLALLIAPRREQNPWKPRSLCVLTVIVAACSTDGISATQTGTSAKSIASERDRLANAAGALLLEALARSQRKVT